MRGVPFATAELHFLQEGIGSLLPDVYLGSFQVLGSHHQSPLPLFHQLEVGVSDVGSVLMWFGIENCTAVCIWYGMESLCM